MQELTNLLQRRNTNKIIKQKLYRLTEVSRLPKDVEFFKIQCLAGGYYMVHMKQDQYGMVILYLGAGSESEPTYRVNHKFVDTESAIFYAMYLYTREDIGV